MKRYVMPFWALLLSAPMAFLTINMAAHDDDEGKNPTSEVSVDAQAVQADSSDLSLNEGSTNEWWGRGWGGGWGRGFGWGGGWGRGFGGWGGWGRGFGFGGWGGYGLGWGGYGLGGLGYGFSYPYYSLVSYPSYGLYYY